jgi:hypothetical protein
VPGGGDLLKTLRATIGEKKPWALTLAAGMALDSGDSDTRLRTARALYEYEGKVCELLFSAGTAYGTDKGRANVDNSNGRADDPFHFNKLTDAPADITTRPNVRLLVKDACDNLPAPDRKGNDESIAGALAVKW